MNYLYHITTVTNQHLFLSSNGLEQIVDGIEYLPYSGLEITKAIFNDAACDAAILRGIFEADGINKQTALAGATIKVSTFHNNQHVCLFKFTVRQYITNSLDFTLKCEPEVVKYQQHLLQRFSKTCRATLGDKACQVDLTKFRYQAYIRKIHAQQLTCQIITEGKIVSLNNGWLTTADERFKFTIIAQQDDILTIINPVYYQFAVDELVYLIPSCDKTFRTCCYFFNNAVNFRGEPAIPEEIKIN